MTKKSALASETEVISLPGNADLLLRPDSSNDIVAISWVFPMGSREEQDNKAGITTLALHMLSRGTKTKNDFDIAVALESLGATFSTDAQKDCAAISIQTTADQWPKTLSIVKEILTEASFPEAEFEVEKEIQINEIIEDLDSPSATARNLFHKTLFKGHPYGHSSIGEEETVSGLSLEEVRAAYMTRFGHFPSTISVVGNVDRAQAIDLVSGLVASTQADALHENGHPPFFQTASGPVNAYQHRDTEAECMLYGFPVPGFRSEDFPALKVMDSIVGGSMDSRLFSEIREKHGLVYQIGSICAPLEWQGYFVISLMSTYQNHDRILFHLEKEIDRLKTTLPEKDEIERAITYLKGTYLMGQEKRSDQAYLLARYQHFGLGIDYIDRFPAMLDKVSLEDIQRVAQTYLNNPVLAIVGPGETTAA